jgi:hypothetical protein
MLVDADEAAEGGLSSLPRRGTALRAVAGLTARSDPAGWPAMRYRTPANNRERRGWRMGCLGS